jgi:hypothetical protein
MSYSLQVSLKLMFMLEAKRKKKIQANILFSWYFWYGLPIFMLFWVIESLAWVYFLKPLVTNILSSNDVYYLI